MSETTPRAITPDWRCRVADYQNFMREDLRQHIHQVGVHVIGYQALKEFLPQA